MKEGDEDEPLRPRSVQSSQGCNILYQQRGRNSQERGSPELLQSVFSRETELIVCICIWCDLHNALSIFSLTIGDCILHTIHPPVPSTGLGKSQVQHRSVAVSLPPTLPHQSVLPFFCTNGTINFQLDVWLPRIIEDSYCKELGHSIMEAEKSQDLQLASWRPRRASGIVPVQVQRPENEKSQWYKFQSENQHA